jgi:RHS repeat-associated protein
MTVEFNPGSFCHNADAEVSTETYDANGNATQVGAKSLTYDSENRMTSMTAGSTMVYDGDGNRVAKTASGVTPQYLVDDLNPTGYAQVAEEVVGGAVARQYTYGLQRISQGQFIGNQWTVSFYGYDGGGNVRNLTSVTGATTDEYEYDAFGNSFTKVGTTPNNYLYRGEQFDSDLGLYYLRARYYNPATGRFMSRDPEDGKPNDPTSLHRYLYAGGDPADFIDPTGRDEEAEYTMFTARTLEETLNFAGALTCAFSVHWYVWDLLKGGFAWDDQAAAIATGVVGCVGTALSVIYL